MSKRCILVDPSFPAADLLPPIDWGKCLLCQKQTREKLHCAGNSLRPDKDAGYESLADILPEFDKLGELPPHLVLSNLDNGSGLCASLKANSGKWHKSCRSKYSFRELLRKKAAAEKQCNTTATDYISPAVPDTDFAPNKRRCTRSEFDTENQLRAENPVCFFCDLPAGQQMLHAVTTFEVDKRVKEAASVLSDDRLLAKLATSDMIALEAKYHTNCLSQLYNRRRAVEREHYGQLSSSKEDLVHSVVFAQLTAYINDVRAVPDIVPVFKLADLKSLYVDRLRQLDPTLIQSVNSTRLKDKLLAYFSDMRAQNDGRDVLLAFDNSMGAALTKACRDDLDDDALHLARAAEIVRRDIFAATWQFHNSLHIGSQEESVPPALLNLVRMVLEGPSIDVQSLEQHTPAALTIAQLMVFNSVRHKRTAVSCVSNVARHPKEQETPLPLYVGLAVHAATRKKRLVDKLFHLGICVSYDRVLSVLNDLACGVCDRFDIENVVCPLNFKRGVFTTAAVDNIDHNPSATTTTGSFHGTGISLHQHPDEMVQGNDKTVSCVPQQEVGKKIPVLPTSYTFVPPVRLVRQEPAIPMSPVVDSDAQASGSNVMSLVLNESEWLQTMWTNWQTDTFSADTVCSWSAFHAQRVTAPQNVALCGMLPLFHEHAQSVAMIHHAMDVIQASVSKLNPSQIPVITFDQPLYTLAKLIQWNWPETHGEGRFVVMFGGLHIEMAALKALGSLLTGSGWVEAITNAGIVSSGTAEGLLAASHVRRCRRVHEITLAVLYILQRMAFEKMHDVHTSFENWCNEQCCEHRQFAFWSSVMKLQTAILLFVRAIRESNFSLYLDSLARLMPYFFALDRTNYARWLSVHIHDLCKLSRLHPGVFSQFQEGKFTVNKTHNRFSGMSIDQAHEQLNATVKGDGGVIGLTENHDALSRFMVCGPEVARLLAEFESDSSLPITGLHHEQHSAVQEAFVSDVRKLVSTLLQMGNPFEDQHDLIVLHSRHIVVSDIAESAGKLFDIGKKQYDDFVQSRLSTANESLFAPIKRNKLTFFAAPKLPKKSKLQSKITAARNDSALFSRLYIACQIRNSDLGLFFSHENQVYPPALSDAGNLHFGCKSDLLCCLESVHACTTTMPDVDAIILDGSAVINMLKPGGVNNFEQYVDTVFMPHIYSQFAKVQRVDVVWDQYDTSSLKHLAHMKRGVGPHQQVTALTPVPRNWQAYLRNADNKTALFCFLAEYMCSKPLTAGKHLVGTHKANVKSSLKDYDTAQLEPCGHEEADTRMLLHAADVISAGYSKILIRTVDTDVVVLAIAYQQKLACEQLWLAFGTGQNFRYISAHDLAASLGPQYSCALPVFHAITGCDTVSAFVGRGKKTCWETWKKFPEVTDAFVALFHMPDTISESNLALLQRYVILLYDSNCRCDTVNAARKHLFANKGKSVENIPPTFDALVQHVRRAVFQAGYVWGQSLVTQPSLPSPSDWGWHEVDHCWQPLWMTIPDAAKCCPELKRCGCKTGCITKRCKCVKDNVPCTALCACDGECRQ